MRLMTLNAVVFKENIYFYIIKLMIKLWTLN